MTVYNVKGPTDPYRIITNPAFNLSFMEPIIFGPENPSFICLINPLWTTCSAPSNRYS